MIECNFIILGDLMYFVDLLTFENRDITFLTLFPSHYIKPLL